MAIDDALRREFAPSGRLRTAVNFGNIVIAQKDTAGGEPRGVGPELARSLAKRLSLPIEYVIYDNAGSVANAAKESAWDVAFLAADPKRAGEIAFTAPYVLIEGTYLVRAESPRRSVEEFDQPGVRIASALNAAYDLHLARTLKQALLVRTKTSEEAVALFLGDELDAAAGVRNALQVAATRNPQLRVIADSYLVIGQAAGVPRGREAAAGYLASFIEEMKASGFVAQALRASGAEATVAPPG